VNVKLYSEDAGGLDIGPYASDYFLVFAPEEIEPMFAIARTLAGLVGWYLLTTQFGLSGEQAGRAVRRAVEVLVADLRRQDDKAARLAASGRQG
jgi:hypothetical protein